MLGFFGTFVFNLLNLLTECFVLLAVLNICRMVKDLIWFWSFLPMLIGSTEIRFRYPRRVSELSDLA